MKLLLSLAFVGQVLAQPSFDVASVKPSPGIGSISRAPLTDGKFTARNVNVRTLIRASYRVQDFQISGAPNWLESDRYDIDAKSATPASAEDTRLMVQSGSSGRQYRGDDIRMSGSRPVHFGALK